MILPRRILMTADTVGGVWTYSMELAHALKSAGIEVAIATMGSVINGNQKEQVSDLGLTIYESNFKLEWMEEPWRDLDAAGEWLLDIERRFHPDLIHLNNYAHGNLPWEAPVLVVGHSCVFSWWHAVHGVAPPDEWSEYRERVRAGLKAADAIAAVSRTMLRDLQRWYSAPGGSVIYNGHGWCAYTAAQKEDFVLSTGRLWDAAKNIATLDTAARSVPWPIYIAGDAQHPEGGRRQFDNVHQLGHLSSENLRGWFGRASIYALPALYEPFGLSILEAALSGCALILGDIPSLREIWGDAALFVPPLDDAAIAGNINLLIESRTTRNELGSRARERAVTFTTERMIQMYLDLYRDILAQSRSQMSNAIQKETQTTCAL